MKKLALINGYPFTGKTRLATHIVRSYGAVRLSTDDMRDMLHAAHYGQTSEQQENFMYSMMARMRDSYLATGTDVVVDSAAAYNALRRYFLGLPAYENDNKELTVAEVLDLVPNLSRDTLQSWRRKGYVEARKDRIGKQKIYLYAENEVPKIRRMSELVSEGYAPRSAARLAESSQPDAEKYLILLRSAPEAMVQRAIGSRGLSQEHAEQCIEIWDRYWEEPAVGGAHLLEFENSTEDDFHAIAGEMDRLFAKRVIPP